LSKAGAKVILIFFQANPVMLFSGKFSFIKF